jgi:hypothetical protein
MNLIDSMVKFFDRLPDIIINTLNTFMKLPSSKRDTIFLFIVGTCVLIVFLVWMLWGRGGIL